MSNRITSQVIADYWDQCTDLYLQHMTTFQAGLFARPGSADPFRENALAIARRADIQMGQKVLDLGCGVCGPAVEIARHLADVSFVCVTNCARQVEVARERVASYGLGGRIEVLHLDYHNISSLTAQFDRCLFLESFGYTVVPRKLMKLAFEALLPGGLLYAKDVCHKWNLTEREAVELAEFNATYCYNTPLLKHVRESAEIAGFDVRWSEVITSQMYRAHSQSSMFVNPGVSSELTDFGRRHFKGFTSLPIDFYEFKAARPVQS